MKIYPVLEFGVKFRVAFLFAFSIFSAVKHFARYWFDVSLIKIGLNIRELRKFEYIPLAAFSVAILQDM